MEECNEKETLLLRIQSINKKFLENHQRYSELILRNGWVWLSNEEKTLNKSSPQRLPSHRNYHTFYFFKNIKYCTCKIKIL